MENTRINVVEISSIEPHKEKYLDRYEYYYKSLFRKEGFYQEGYYIHKELTTDPQIRIENFKAYRLPHIYIRMNNGCQHCKDFDSNAEMSKYLKSSRFKHLTLLEL